MSASGVEDRPRDPCDPVLLQIDPTGLRATSAPPGAPDAAVLSISSLSKRWPRQEPPVLHDIDLELRPGELVWLTGENGAGKTTLLRIVAGIVAPDSGTVRSAAWTCRARGAPTSAGSAC